MTRDQVTVIEQPSGGLQIMIQDDETDSLVIVELQKHQNDLCLRTGMRGNLSAKKRPIHWVSTSLAAPPVSQANLAARKARKTLSGTAPARLQRTL